MGTYVIGVSRLVVAIIEVHHDEKGIVWPLSVAPFHVALLNLKHSNPLVQEKCNTIYEKLMRAGIEVLYDDRDERAGVKFNDMDLIGLPYQILVSEKSLSSDELEIKNRKTNEAVFVTLDNFILQLQEALKKPF
jgi:prolyl-tRNA synthetase